MTRDEKIAEAKRRVLNGGEVPRVVAADLGIGRSTIYQWVWPERYSEARPERRAQKCAWENANDRRPCVCGALMGAGTHRRGQTHCDGCRREMAAVGRAMRREPIYDMWHEGLRLTEIAAKVGISLGNIKKTVTEMRIDGWDMPYRHSYPTRVTRREQAA